MFSYSLFHEEFQFCEYYYYCFCNLETSVSEDYTEDIRVHKFELHKILRIYLPVISLSASEEGL